MITYLVVFGLFFGVLIGAPILAPIFSKKSFEPGDDEKDIEYENMNRWSSLDE